MCLVLGSEGEGRRWERVGREPPISNSLCTAFLTAACLLAYRAASQTKIMLHSPSTLRPPLCSSETCTGQDLADLGDRLRDWFQLLHENSKQNGSASSGGGPASGI